MNKAWEQIAFAIALAGFGWLLFNQNKKATKASTAVQGIANTPFFYSSNAQQTTSASFSPSTAASSVPIPADAAGTQFADNYLAPLETLFPTDDYA